MQTEQIVLDRAEAREAYRAYKKHVHYSQPIDREIQRVYQLIAQGRVVIKALESIKAAGLNEQGLPKLAIVRADAKECFWRPDWQGSTGHFDMSQGWSRDSPRRFARQKVQISGWSAIQPRVAKSGKAIVPIVPINLRPKRGLANYHILFEAEWTPIPPKDPFLLRRIGKGDMWLVVAAWDLTVVEQAALAARISG